MCHHIVIYFLAYRFVKCDKKAPLPSTQVYEQNSAELLRGLWNLLVVRLWVGLCNTFDAVAEVKAVAEAGLSLDAGPKKCVPHVFRLFSCAF